MPAGGCAEKGSSLIELIMVMALLILFGFTIYSLIYTGSTALKKIEAQKDAQMDARIAVSYMNVRLRQNDGWEQISIQPNTINGQNAIVLAYRDPADPSNDYDTWIFWADGVLQEVLADAGGEPEWLGANPIVAVDSFTTQMDGSGVITNTIYYAYQGETQSISSVYTPRSGRRSA